MSQINLTAVFIANIMGVTLLFSVLISSFWTSKLTLKGNKELMIMLIVSGLSCIADPVCFIADGKPGMLNYILVFWCNTWLYIGNIIVAVFWISLISKRLNHTISKIHKATLAVISTAAMIMIIINIFTPIIFSVNENNVYARCGINWIYYVLHIMFMLDGLLIYFYVQLKTHSFKFFPVWAFIIPVALGMSIQGFYYGVSTVTPFTMIALACLTGCLQNELLFTDKLTGLYNRYYLDVLEKRVHRTNSLHTIMMIDINHFKAINDTYGHNVGDKAIIETSIVLKDVIKEDGEVLRYAGDEFIIIINTQEASEVQNKILRIREKLNEFNCTGENPYNLSVAIGSSKLDLNKNTMDDILDMVDKRMYEDKRECYKND